jgi:hypothetical protein
MATLEEVVEFYDRGGDFPASNVEVLIQPLGMNAGNKSDLIAFMTNELTDPRVPAEAAPLFDRPMLYSESARIPQLTGTATTGTGGRKPRMMAIEPAFAGNPNFTVGLYDARPGAQAVLLIDDQLPGTSLAQAMASARQVVEVKAAPQGYASAVLALPNEAGLTLFGRWYVNDPNAAGGTALSEAFRVQLFSGGRVEAGVAASVSAASFVQAGAPESLVSTFGAGLAGFRPMHRAAITVLGGASVVVQDGTGAGV